jgi:U3 small nucleolar RNA-associated protein 11
MASLRNAVPQKTHKERHQPGKRQKLGFLEKHKDYVKRAQDYNKKQATIKKLEQKAAFRNPDEYYFKMVNTRKVNGIHRKVNGGPQYTNDEIAEMKQQDMAYVSMRHSMEAKKIEKLQNSLGFLDEVGPTKLAERHTIFVSDEEEAEEFDAEEFFNTPKELLTRAYNRPTKDMIENDVIIINKDKVTKKDLLDIEKAKASSYKELRSRMSRDNELKKTLFQMQLKRALMSKGSVIKKKKKDGSVSFKWKKERKT